MKLRILLIDDDSLDRELFIEGATETEIPCTIHEVTNGQEALHYLENANSLPDVIFLDLNMPVIDGRTTLKEIKSNSSHNRIPVFILSTSNSKRDIDLCYELGANLFVVKPNEFKEFQNILSCLLTVFNKYMIFPI